MVVKPTVYRGIQYRSRLEAKWAAFFDLLNWRFDYEPFDLKGWVPDFILYGEKEDVLVEIKPITKFCVETSFKIERANPKCDVLLIGTSPFVIQRDYNIIEIDYMSAEIHFTEPPIIGWLGEYYPEELDSEYNTISKDSYSWQKCYSWFVENRWDFCPDEGSFRGRLTGYYDGNHYNGDVNEANSIAENSWAKAINIVQKKY